MKDMKQVIDQWLLIYVPVQKYSKASAIFPEIYCTWKLILVMLATPQASSLSILTHTEM